MLSSKTPKLPGAKANKRIARNLQARRLHMRKSVFYFVAVAALAAGQAYAARPVARWDVVPHQRISGVFNAGVVAFH